MKAIVYNDDGWSSLMRYPAPMSPEEIVRVTVGPLAGTAVKVFQFCALGGHAVNYRSSFLPRVGEMMAQVDTMHVWRMRETLRHLDERGTDPLRIACAACRERGIACHFSLRMNDAHHVYHRPDGSHYFPELLSPWLDAHPQALLPSGQLDYAGDEARDYRIAQVAEVLERYDVDGIDLDFTRFRPWFREGREEAGMPLMTELVRCLREMAAARGKALTARLEYDPGVCIASGLDLECWFAEGLLDHVTLGGIGDHTPDAPADWFIERAHPRGCRVYPSVEGQLHWVPGCGAGGTGLRPRNGVADGFGPPSLEYLRAVASVHYHSDADGLSLFNFTCADGPFPRAVFTELADPEAMALRDKVYVAAVWPHGAQIYYAPWESRFRMEPEEDSAAYTLRLADDPERARASCCEPSAILTLDLRGLNRVDDVDVLMNGTPLRWTGDHYNHYDHGCWDDTLRFSVPASALRRGGNRIELCRRRRNAGFAGAIQVRKCVLHVGYPGHFTPGAIACGAHE